MFKRNFSEVMVIANVYCIDPSSDYDFTFAGCIFWFGIFNFSILPAMFTDIPSFSCLEVIAVPRRVSVFAFPVDNFGLFGRFVYPTI